MSDVQKLIAEARAVASDSTFNGTHRRDLFLELASALEAATSPVEPEPVASVQDDREALATILNKAGAYCGGCDFESGPGSCVDCADALALYAAAILAAGFARPVAPEPAAGDHVDHHDDREALVSALVDALGDFPDGETLDPNRSYLTQEAECAADAVLAAGFSRPVGGEASDGYHTFDELYEFRMLYHRHAVSGWLAAGVPVVKSWRHSDGEECFGGDWFIVVASLPVGQVSNHYPAEDWGLFEVPEVEIPPAFDGHTSSTVVERLRGPIPVGGETATEWEWAVQAWGDDEPWSDFYDSRELLLRGIAGTGGWAEGEEMVRRRKAGPWSSVSPEQDEDEFQPGECTGSDSCTVPVHTHGCFADTVGACDDPGDHPKGPEQDGVR
ncbi:hypothetical protein M2390_003256 [Mycetocola sp. BIGb0189]|nr:hypothetical protein [Mycetocola sp. BIGb0189]